MRAAPGPTAVLLLAAAGAPLFASSPVRVRPVASHRGLPHVFHDQAVDSLKATVPQVQFVERLRTERMGNLIYALVAWKRDPRAENVEVSAAAVQGRHAWDLELSTPVDSYPAARATLMEELRVLSGPPVPPKAEITLHAKGQPIPLASDTAELLWDVEVLIASCNFRIAATPVPAGGALDLRVRYAEPRTIGLEPRGLGGDTAKETPIAIQEIRIAADPARNTGWPLESVRHSGGEAGLGKCDGGGTLRLLCRPELRPHAPSTVTSGCRLLVR